MNAEDAKAAVAAARQNPAITDAHRTRARELVGLALGVGLTLEESVELIAAKLAETSALSV